MRNAPKKIGAAAKGKAPRTEEENPGQLDAILDTAVDAIITIDQQGMVESYNRSAQRIFGYEAKEVIGQNVRMLMPEPFQSEHDGYLSNYLRTGEKKIIGIGREVEGKRKDQSLIPMELAVSSFHLNGEPKFAGIMRDITERKEAEEALALKVKELQESNDALDEFVYIASHDLKEPLRGISNFSSFLMEDYQDKLDEDGRHKLHTLVNLAGRMESLIENLRYYSRVGRQKLAMNSCSLDEVLDDVLVNMQTAISESGIEVRRIGKLPTVNCDSVRIGEVFLNLISNAIKYNESTEKWIEIGCLEEGAVKLPAKADGNGNPHAAETVIYARDNGIGIRERHLETIFKIFKRLHAREKFGGGSGIGLSIVKRIVERHGGLIWLTSEPGAGTTFYLSLGSR
jgi:PAS domain S-box-containing protein